MEATDKKVLKIKLDDILPNRFQPRIKFEEKTITELAESIKEHGVIQPIVVRPIADKYEIIAGERRYKASVMCGKYDIPAIIVDLDDKESAEIALIENVQRQDLTPIEEAISYKKILDMGYLTQQQLASKLGKSQASIANKMRLLNLDEDVQEALLNEKISERHARSLLKLDLPKQKELLDRIINERLTVRKTDEEINKILGKPKANAKKLEVINFEEKKEEKIMNENANQEPIMSEQPSQQPNPGFMDINKIEETASDIFEPVEPAPVESLLKQDTLPEEPVLDNSNLDSDLLTNGKFFSVLSEDTDESTSSVLDNDIKLNVDNDSVFQSNLDTTLSVNPVSENPVEEFKTQEPIIPSTSATNDSTGMISNNEAFDASLFTMPVNMPASVDSILPKAEELDLNPIKPMSLDENKLGDEDPIVPTIEEIEEVSIPENPVEVPLEATSSTLIETPIIEEGVVEPVHNNLTTNTYVVGDLKTVINTIRNCADTIEKYGYIVDLDEMDFEDTYQVIFKVQKKK